MLFKWLLTEMTNRIYRSHLARKRFGQNFLRDQFVIDSIISKIDPKKGQVIVEIGPGLAALTEPIAKYLDKLIVVELDRDLVRRLKTHPFLHSKLIIYQKDVMSINFDELAKEMGKPIRIFGNLPYNISTKLIFHLFNYTDNIVDMYFMLQKEVVNRLVAEPNSKEYGRLSVMAQYFYKITSILEVPSSAFFPKPKVNSAVVHLVPHKIWSEQTKNLQVLKHITTKAFNQRRKTIRNSLGKLFTLNTLVKLGIDLKMRAENISVKQYCELINYIDNNISVFSEKN